MTKFDEFMHNMAPKSICILGMGISNTPLIELFLKNNFDVTVCDCKSKDKLGDDYDRFLRLGAKFNLGEGYLDNLDFDVIFRAPGVHPNNPKILKALENGSVITSEMEIFMDTAPCKIIAVTGSDGKTTTTTLVYEILSHAGFNCHLGGNIGNPLLCTVPNMQKDDICVLELSSFQLMTIKKSADICAVTNITPNHLDVHKDMREYVEAKKMVFSHQSTDGIAVFNRDDEISKSFLANKGVKTLFFSMNQSVEDGAYFEDGNIIFARNGQNQIVMNASDIKIPGKHNIYNFLTAMCITSNLCSNSFVKETAINFGGVAHRIEFVRMLNGVRYYNDSIASSPTRTIAGLGSFDQKLILIAGGYDKNLSYDELGIEINNRVKHLILVGDTSLKIKSSVVNASNYNLIDIDIFDDFETAIKRSKEVSKDGDIIMLSPASASFDRFKNFEERGETFRKIVSQL